MKTTTKTIIALTAAIALIGTLVLTTGNDTSTNSKPVSENNSIQVGWIGPLTGEAAVYGEPMQKVTKLAVKAVNQNGGINGRPLEVIYEDGKCRGKAAASAAQKLVNEVEIILGGFCSDEALAAEPITTKNEVLQISGGASSPDLSGMSPYFSRTFPADDVQGKVLANAAYNQKGWREVAFIREKTDYALGVYESFTNRFEELGGTVIDSTFAPETTDFRTQLSKLETQDPDALFVDVQAAPSANRILTQTKELNWQPPVLLTNSIAPDTELLSSHAEILEGGLATVLEVDNTNSHFQNLKTAYQDEYGSDLPYPSFSQVMWDTVKLAAAGMREVGTDGEALSSWVRNQNDFVGASGPISINNDGDRVGSQTLKIIRGGELQDAGE